MKFLTVIIPSYNTYRHLGRTPRKFLSQRVRESVDFLFVDDGSTDGKTGTAVEEYAAIYTDCCRVVHQPNLGHGGAINTGVNIVETPYFKVMDGDDELEEEGLLRLACHLATMDDRRGPDLIVNPYWNVYSSSSALAKPWTGRGIENPTMAETKSATGVTPTLHSLTYKTSFYRSTALVLPEHTFYEDNLYSLIPLLTSKTILLLPWPVYLYFRELPGQSTSKKGRQAHRDDSRAIQKLLWSAMEKTLLHPSDGTSLFLENMSSHADSALKWAIANGASREEVLGMLKKYQEIHNLWEPLKERALVRFLTRTNCHGIGLLRPIIRRRFGY